jgi:hypothetical protein
MQIDQMEFIDQVSPRGPIRACSVAVLAVQLA